jgi:hypothetical protein
VKVLDSPHLGHAVRETDDKIVVFEHYDYRFDIPKPKMVTAGRNVMIEIDFPELLKYRVDREMRHCPLVSQ